MCVGGLVGEYVGSAPRNSYYVDFGGELKYVRIRTYFAIRVLATLLFFRATLGVRALRGRTVVARAGAVAAAEAAYSVTACWATGERPGTVNVQTLQRVAAAVSRK